MNTTKKLILIFSFTFLIFFLAESILSAQGYQRGGARNPNPGVKPPGPAAPSTPSKPKAPAPPTVKKNPGSGDSNGRIEKGSESGTGLTTTVTPPGAASAPPLSPWDIDVLPHAPGDLNVIRTSWVMEAKNGTNPFTSVTVKVVNHSKEYIAIHDLWISGLYIEPMDKKDKRPLPSFPFVVNRFDNKNRLGAPIPPHSVQSLTFAFPFALRSTAKLKARVNNYTKFSFRFKPPATFDPVVVKEWNTDSTTSAGSTHKGLFITVENQASVPVHARLKISLDQVASAGGRTFFFTDIVLARDEEKTVMLRTIPDEGIVEGKPSRKSKPDHFVVKKVEVADVQF